MSLFDKRMAREKKESLEFAEASRQLDFCVPKVCQDRRIIYIDLMLESSKI
ncbi:MAG: hypothetical protein KJ706_00050 [Candidatus Omnitrophica bacterium]|nr:hypothetical protein [Candidatus Omnitrophota bacterium]MBU4589302.1 hypothetical protein [Candidatus Omnitrophota bacterium]